MSTTTVQQAPGRSRGHEYKLGFGGVLKSEFLKFRTLVSSWVLMAVTVVLMGSLSALLAWVAKLEAQSAHDVPNEVAQSPEAAAEYTRHALESARSFAYQAPSAGLTLAYLILASMAVILVSSEFGTKSIISTFTAAPRRSQVFVAKAVVIAVAAALVAVVSILVGWAVTQLVLVSSPDDIGFGLFEPKVLWNVLGVVAVFVLTAWMGYGFGALLRNSAGAIVVTVAVLFVLPILFAFLTSFDWARDFGNYLPQYLAGMLSNPNGVSKEATDSALGARPGSYAEALGWYAVWCVVPLIAGFVAFVRRDPK